MENALRALGPPRPNPISSHGPWSQQAGNAPQALSLPLLRLLRHAHLGAVVGGPPLYHNGILCGRLHRSGGIFCKLVSSPTFVFEFKLFRVVLLNRRIIAFAFVVSKELFDE